MLAEHADALLDRAAVAEADLAAAAGTVTGRARIAGFRSVVLQLALPAMAALADDAPRLRCEVVEAEPEQALPALALGDVDLVLGDEWQHQPWRLPAGLARHDLFRDPVSLLLPAAHPVARAHPEAVPLAALADEPWATGHAGMGWEDVVQRTCRELGGFEPDLRHRANDATISLALVGRRLRGHDAARAGAARRAPGHRGAPLRRAPGRPGDRRRDARRRRRAALDAGAARGDPGGRRAARLGAAARQHATQGARRLVQGAR